MLGLRSLHVHTAALNKCRCVPLQGAKSEAFGPFSPKAELLNGRAAMIGE